MAEEKQKPAKKKVAQPARTDKAKAVPAEQQPVDSGAPARLKELYKKEVAPALTQQFGYKTPMQVPRISKITLNMGVGEATADKKILDNAVGDMTKISGQKPVVTKARKAIAGFKIREGYPIGCTVTLRHERMYEFLDRLISIALPRIRDFRGLNPRSFDGRGNYSLGIREQIIFPEIDYDSIDQVRGLDVTITTTAGSDEEAFALLVAFGMPFSKEGRPGGPDADAEAAAEEERRKEEARARAEAEQAALEQLKEENPEAYAKRERPSDEDEEGAEGEAAEAGQEPDSSDD